MSYTDIPATVMTTDVYESWFNRLRDARAAKRIVERIYRLAHGNPGRYRALSGGVCEMKIDYGPGYRVYYIWRGAMLIVLLCAGDKRTQNADIRLAERLATEI